MKISGETRIALILALITFAGLAAFILFRKSDEIERVVDTVTPSFAGKDSLADTHWTFTSPNGAAYNVKFDSETRAQLRWEDDVGTDAGVLSCDVAPGGASAEGLRVLRLTCQGAGSAVEQTLLISAEDGQRHAALLNAHTGSVWFERLDNEARGNGLAAAEQALYLDEFGKSEPSPPGNTCQTRFSVIDMLRTPANIRVSRYLKEGEARPGMKIVGPEYSRREFTAEWAWEWNESDMSGELGDGKPLKLKAGPYSASPEGPIGDSGYHVEVTGADGEEINAFDIYPDQLEYCATHASEMTVLIVLARPSSTDNYDRRVSYRYQPTRGCNAFVKVTNETTMPLDLDVWTNENDGFGGFAGNIFVQFGKPALEPGASLWAHAEVPGIFASASVRSEYGEDLAGINRSWLYPDLHISAYTASAALADNPDKPAESCGGGLTTPTNLYAPLEQCLRKSGSVFLDLTLSERRTSNGCSLSVDLN
jgi:hypothetical protein